ncbi:aquaporin [Ekhidna sp.]|uniref:MIP/aquaporin family protein n=1 Tax=Ekhidna sp. TaxID=2608089 RepID=UPI00329880C9
MMKKYLAELVGTFCLVLVGAGSIAISLPHIWISIAFGAIVTLMILCFGHVSGAHINPAVSVGFYLFNGEKQALVYIPFQLIGGLLAGIFLSLVLPQNPTYGETMPSSGIGATILIEIFITFALMLSILLIVETNNLRSIAVVVGFVVFLAAYFAGPFTGASMNPARSFGPAVVSNTLDVLWIYFLAPVIGSALSVPFYHFFKKIRTK